MATLKDRLKVVNWVKALVLKHHFNVAKIDYAAWSREVDRLAPALAAADDPTFQIGMRELLAGLKSSHTNFYRSDSQPTKPQHAIGATLRSVEQAGAARWMFLDVYEQSPAAAAGIRPGDILLAMNGKVLIPPTEPPFGLAKFISWLSETSALGTSGMCRYRCRRGSNRDAARRL